MEQPWISVDSWVSWWFHSNTAHSTWKKTETEIWSSPSCPSTLMFSLGELVTDPTTSCWSMTGFTSWATADHKFTAAALPRCSQIQVLTRPHFVEKWPSGPSLTTSANTLLISFWIMVIIRVRTDDHLGYTHSLTTNQIHPSVFTSSYKSPGW